MMTRARIGVITMLVCLVTARLGSASDQAVHRDLQAYMTTQASAFQNLTTFSFGVFSDIHMTESSSEILSRAQWASLLSSWRDTGMAFGVIVGDLGYGNATDPSNVLSGPATVTGAPKIFYGMGNHEIDGIGKRAWIDALYPGAVQSSSWTSVANAPGNSDRAYWSFNIGPYTHLVFLDGDIMSSNGLAWYTRQTAGAAQMAWFASDVAANLDKNILVFVHEPVEERPWGDTPDYTLNDKGGILDILATVPKQAFVFSGHLHGFQGITKWKSVTSVHVMTGISAPYGVVVSVSGTQISVSGTGTSTITQFDTYPMNQVTSANGQNVIAVAEDGTYCGSTRAAYMAQVGPTNGIYPTSGTEMLTAANMTWYAPRFISEQVIKIMPGMTFSYDLYLDGVTGGLDAVTVQPNWYMRDDSLPPRVVDENGLQLSQRPRDALYFADNEDVPLLGGRATGNWYHRVFDLSALAGNWVDGVYLTASANNVNVANIYVDNIRFSWPTTSGDAPPTVWLMAPAAGATFPAAATIGLSATATDPDGTIGRVDFYANSRLIGTVTAPPYTFTWPGVAAGTYNLTAVATDNAGLQSKTGTITVTAADAPPTVTLTAPTNGATFTAPATVQMNATASDPDGTIARVDFWAGYTFVGSVTSPPYALTWYNAPVGTYWVSAVATDNGGLQTTSPGGQITIGSSADAPPSVAVTAPANGAAFTAPATISLSASASDSDGTVARVDFYANGRLLGSAATPPYGLTWSSVVAGSYSITAIATDNVGLTTTSTAITVTVTADLPPTVSLTAPANNATFVAPATVSLSASAVDPDGTIARVAFYANGLALGSTATAPYALTWSGVAAGSYSITAVATDNAALATTSAPIAVTVNADQPPTVSMTAPTNGATFSAGSTIAVTATAADVDGTIARVDIYANRILLGSSTFAPYTTMWTNVPTGKYKIRAVATDNAGLSTASSTIQITVQ